MTDMLFADIPLARRIEEAGSGLLGDSARAVARRQPDVMARPFAGGVAVYTGAGSPLNKVAGVGFTGALDAAELEEVERAFAAVGSPVQFELSDLAEAGIGALLTGRGYRLVGFENVLGRSLPAPPFEGIGSGVEVERSGDDELPIWVDILSTGFANPDTQGVVSHESLPHDEVDRVMSDMATTEGLVRYLARREGVPAGGASMHATDGICQLCGAATLPEHRRRGVQSAMLARRLEDATRAGCELAVVTTLPGSKSQQNVQRLGFQLLYTRAILVLEKEW